MTVEIAVMNKTGIALAADSAVTIGSTQKIFNSANKLFMLSKYHPVGIMVYNNSSFMGYPWEILIKEYRSFLGSRTYDTIEGYGSSFLSWIKSAIKSLDLPDSESVISAYITNIFDELFQQVEGALSRQVSDDTPLKQIQQLVEMEIGEYSRHVSSHALLQSLPVDFRSKMTLRYSTLIDDLISESVSTEFLTEKACECLKQIPLDFLERNMPSTFHSGIVIAGYGSNDMFPGLVEYNVDGYFLDWMRHTNGKVQKVNMEHESFISAYAQPDMISTFLEGVDPRYEDLIENYVMDLLYRQYPETILSDLNINEEPLKTEFEKKLQEIALGLMKDFKRQKDTYRRERHILPVLNTIKALPKDELAAAAETLVNLTSFKRRISPDSETVGGPIDVCVISKGDGFIWIKRKHYFDPKLNNNFFRNYFIDGEGGDDDAFNIRES